MSKYLKNKRYQTIALALAVIVLIGHPILSHAQYEGSGFLGRAPGKGFGVQNVAFTAMLEKGPKAAEMIQPASDFESIRAFYAARGNAPLWTADRASMTRAREVVRILEKAGTHGLNPAHYEADRINELLGSPLLLAPQKARLELMLSVAVTRYGRDMTGMRANPDAIRQKASFWRQPVAAGDLLTLVAASRNPAQVLDGLAPKTEIYKALQKELARLTAEQKARNASGVNDDPVPLSFGGAYIFSPGQKHKDVVLLRQRMGVTYDPASGPETLYDPALVKAVIAYQTKHSMDNDGRIGSKTLALLNRTRAEKLGQVVATMERIRWLDPQMPERYVLVNIPSQTLYAYDGGRLSFDMPVIVGLPQRQTRDFTTQITGVRFNPTWTVPMGIKVADMLPKLQKDPAALVAEKNLTFFNGLSKSADRLDPEDVNWDGMSRAELSRIQMIQPPGDNNALGRVRVIMPNEFDIYLHDTNHPELFAKNDRALSSGCVRLSDPRKVAHFLLAHNEGWSKSKMTSLIDAGQTVDIPVQASLPVYIVYQTVWLDQKGELIYGPDLYKRDRKLIETLAAEGDVDLPGVVMVNADMPASSAMGQGSLAMAQ